MAHETRYSLEVVKAWTESGMVPDALRSEPPPARVRSVSPAEIGVAFQPIVDLKKKRTYAAEMLVRCRSEPFRDPAFLFEQAELQRATGRLGRLIREVGVERAPDLPLFLNLHPHELSERWVVRTDDPMNYIERGIYLEITESAALDYYDLCRGALAELCSRLGAKLVVDDFGAGQSNLLRIAELRPAVVKLDRSLVADSDRSSTKQTILKHTVALCRDLGAKVVAEGIEREDELRCLIDLDVDYGQGYLLARPGDPMPSLTWPAGV
ncbi:MAG: EAL domain-containing protein [Sandaracinaceae bacterium]